METEQRIRIIEEKLESLGVTVNCWAKQHELDHRIVEDLIRGNLQGTRGVAQHARRIMEDFFGTIFDK